MEGLEGVAALQRHRRLGQLRTSLGAPLGHHHRVLGVVVAQLGEVGLEQVEVLHPAVPAEVLVDPDQIEVLIGELLGGAEPAVDVDRDRQRGVRVAGHPSGRHQIARGARQPVGRGVQLVGHRVREHGGMAAGRLHGALDAHQRAPALPRLPEQVGAAVALPDRRLVPDQDPGSVEAGEQPVVHEVVRTGDVGAQLLQVVHDRVHVRAGERRTVAGHVLVDRGAPELHPAVVQVQEAALDRHRSQADAPALDLHHLARVAQHDAGRVELRVVRVTRAAGRVRAPTAGAACAPRAGRADEKVRFRVRPPGRAEPDLHGGIELPDALALEQPVDQQLGAAASGRPAAAHLRHGAQVREVRAARGYQPHRAHDAVPVPPALEQPRVLAAVHDHDQLVLPARSQAAGLDGEGRVGVDVAAQAAPVEEHARPAAARSRTAAASGSRAVWRARRTARGSA